MKTLLSIAVLALLSTSAFAADEEKKQTSVVTVCRNEAATKYETSLAAITIRKYSRAKGGGYIVGGVVKLEDRSKKYFQCTFNKKQEFEKVRTVADPG